MGALPRPALRGSRSAGTGLVQRWLGEAGPKNVGGNGDGRTDRHRRGGFLPPWAFSGSRRSRVRSFVLQTGRPAALLSLLHLPNRVGGVTVSTEQPRTKSVKESKSN